jgi:hypothetical protein
MIAVVFLMHVALVMALGAKKLRPVRPVINVPRLQLAAAPDEFIALNDPTLFALPQANDFSADIRLQTPRINPPSFRWTEPPRWLPLTTPLGGDFARYMQTNPVMIPPPDFKPAPQFNEPEIPDLPGLPPASTLHLRGELAGRQLLRPLVLADWPAADVIAPSKVQVLVDAAGRVVSAVLLPPDSGLNSAAHEDQPTRDDNADQSALNLARSAQFTPAPQLTVGQMIFNWRTIPPPATNAAANLP